MTRFRVFLAAALCSFAAVSFATDTTTDLASKIEESSPGDSINGSEEDLVDAGHSYHGEAFNEGPRQAATLVPGLGAIKFPTSTQNEAAQKFFEQGIAWLHGFAYLEAERSFRQAVKLDPEMVMAYWGMAMANVNNSERARGMIDEAKSRLGKSPDKRERLYVEALDRYLPKSKADKKDDAASTDAKAESKAAPDAASKPNAESDATAKRKRAEKFIADLENILYEFPDDIEAKAFLVLRLWMGEREGVAMTSRFAVDALMSEIFAVDPLHPAHHYRIHLWDRSQAKLGLDSSAKCGPSLPGVAHMWHMPGHIYSRLHRYADAAWQQEASARVDHAHMNRARLMPDEIHNFAHNNEWLVRNLLFLGRVNDAVEQSKNLVSLPRHPKYNSLEKRGSYQYGRERLLQTYTEFGLWEQLASESDAAYWHAVSPPSSSGTPADLKATQADEDWLGWLAAAYFQSGKPAQGGQTLRSLHRRRIALEIELLDLADAKSKAALTGEPAGDSPNEEGATGPQQDETANETPPSRSVQSVRDHLANLRRVISRASAAAAAHRRDPAKVKEFAKKANLDVLIAAQWTADAGDIGAALESVRSEVKRRQGQVRPQAILVDLLWRNKEHEEAKKQFETLRKLAGDADLDSPLLQRMAVVAAAVPIEGDWRIKPTPADDLGQRPPLDSLGTYRWQPSSAPTWEATTPDGTIVHSEQFSGRPRIVVFYLGFGCLHCMEQLQALSPRYEAFVKAGIEIVAISTENAETLQNGLLSFDKPMPIPLLADGEQSVFKAYRCWDDFENQALHGTFLIDGQNRVRWQDIGYEPFMDVDFLLAESQRLLGLPIESVKDPSAPQD